MKIHAKIYSLLLFLVFIVGCDSSSDPNLSSEAEAYLKNIISIMQKNSINRKSINWESFTANVLKNAKGAQTINDEKVNIAIVHALTNLQDSHSFLITNKGNYLFGFGIENCSVSSLFIPAEDKEIGYIKVGAFFGSASEANTFVETIQNRIKEIDSSTIKGWIVDLRGNTGGNMWPMMAGIGPILGEGTAGYFIDPDGNEFLWGYFNGETTGIKVTTPYILQKTNPKVAVLTDQATASSGEAIAIAFRGRNNTRSFGLPTCGLSTANQSFTLAGGATLYLTVATMADRTKKLYGKKVVPDVVESNQQISVQQAINWLKE